jgi:uncharacterized protein (DUF934 family)
MSTLITLTPAGLVQVRPLPVGAFRPAPEPRPLPDLAALNAGQGDSRSKIRPNVAWPDSPSVTASEHGPLLRPADLATATGRGLEVVVMPQEDPAVLAPVLDRIGLIALEFPRFSDGRSSSSAVLLRERLGYRGPLRAVGDVLIDQLYALAQVGFDQFALRGDQDPSLAAAALTTFPFSPQAVLAQRRVPPVKAQAA